MASCLGISTENNLIKYAKVSKEHDAFHIEAFGVKFYEKLEEAVEQIVEETQSKNIPINMNLTDELYNHFNVFSGLNKKDIKSVLESEFELLCEEKSLNFNALESKYILCRNHLDKENITAIYISADKGDMAGKLQKMQDFNIVNLIPNSVAITNLLNETKENVAIVNIEDKTTVTIMMNNEISDVQVIELGMEQILEKINKKENSYSKAYNACKSTTIYTMESKDSQMDGNEHLEDIIPTLYEIITQVKAIFDENVLSVQKLYITGTASIINNIDLYFQEHFTATKCEILVPNISAKTGTAYNVKDYIEVNSAVALAKQGLGEGVQDVNFRNIYSKNNIGDAITSTFGGKFGGRRFTAGLSRLANTEVRFDIDFKKALDKTEKDMIIVGTVFMLILVIYTIISVFLVSAINQKTEEVQLVLDDTTAVIASINEDSTKVKNKRSEYTDKIQKLEDLNQAIREEFKYRKAIPNLLNSIMASIPKNVQLTSIENAQEDKIVINAQAEKIEELGYFVARLKSDGILLNVTSTPGQKEDAVVKITIEGNLP